MSDTPNGMPPSTGRLVLTFDAAGNFGMAVEGAVPIPAVVNALEVAKATFVHRQLALIALQAQQQAGKRLVLPDGSLAPAS